MISKIKGFLAKCKFNNDLAEITKRCNEQYKSDYQVVTCEYCGGQLLKKEAGVVYDIEHNMIEYSHDDCWHKNNKVSNEPPVPI